MKHWLALVFVAIGTLPARADPISGAVAGVAAWYAGLGVAGQLLVQIGLSVALTAASYGVQYLISRNGQRQQEAQVARDQRGIELPEYSPLLRVTRAYGELTTAGGVFFHKTARSAGSSSPDRWIFGMALSEGICEELISVVINGEECRIDANGEPIDAPWNNGITKFFEVSFRNGTDDQAIDSLISSYFPDPPEDFFPDDDDATRTTKWAGFRQRGVCTVVLDMAFGATAEQHTAVWGTSIPSLQVKIKGLRLYDRMDATQDPDDHTTWTYTDTATICIEDYMCADIGAQVPRSDIADIAARESIEIDREWIPTLEGLEQRGRISGKVGSEESPVDVIAAMAQQNRATVSRSSGEFVIRADRPAEPVATIHKGLWRDQLAFRNQPDERALISGVVAQFHPASRYSSQAETSYPGSALDDPTATRIGLPYCDSSAAAQRLAYAQVAEAAEGATISGPFDPAVLVAPGKANGQLEIGDVIWFDAPSPYQAMNGLYQVDDLEINFADFSVSLALTGTSADVIDGWSKALETAFDNTAVA